MELTLLKLPSPTPPFATVEPLAPGAPLIAGILDQIIFRNQTNALSSTPLKSQLLTKKVFSLREAILSLNVQQRKTVLNRLSEDEVNQLISISHESHPQLFWNRLLDFSQEQLRAGKTELAAMVAVLGQKVSEKSFQPPSPIQKKFQATLRLIDGRGSLADQVEYSASRFIASTFNPKLIVPMMVGTVAGRLLGTVAWGRLANFFPALQSRIALGTITLAVESPAFMATSIGIRKLAGEKTPSSLSELAQEAALATLSLGLLKSTQFLGHQGFLRLHRFDAQGIPQQLNLFQRFTQVILPYSSMWWGLYAAHSVEAALHLRPPVRGPIAVTEVTTSLLSLSLGAKVGNWMVGTRVANWEERLKIHFSNRFQKSSSIFKKYLQGSSSQKLATATAGEYNLLSTQTPDSSPSAEKPTPSKTRTTKKSPPNKKTPTATQYVRDSLAQYLKDISRYPLLTAAEEIELTKRFQETGDSYALKKLWTSNLRLVVRVVNQYGPRTAHQKLDLIQEGNLSLESAINKFDPNRGIRFATFASYWVRNFVGNKIFKDFRLVGLGTSPSVHKIFSNLNRTVAKLEAQGKKATPEQLAEKLEVKLETINRVAPRILQNDLSIHGKPGQPGPMDYLANASSSPEELLGEGEFQFKLKKVMDAFGQKLNPKEFHIWKHRLLAEAPLTLRLIGINLNLSRERVRQIEERMIKKLRVYLRIHFKEGLPELAPPPQSDGEP